MNLAEIPACESTDEPALHLPCNADEDHAPAGAVPSPAPHQISSTTPSAEMNTPRPGYT